MARFSKEECKDVGPLRTLQKLASLWCFLSLLVVGV